jgi:hypothetical protein
MDALHADERRAGGELEQLGGAAIEGEVERFHVVAVRDFSRTLTNPAARPPPPPPPPPPPLQWLTVAV